MKGVVKKRNPKKQESLVVPSLSDSIIYNALPGVIFTPVHHPCKRKKINPTKFQSINEGFRALTDEREISVKDEIDMRHETAEFTIVNLVILLEHFSGIKIPFEEYLRKPATPAKKEKDVISIKVDNERTDNKTLNMLDISLRRSLIDRFSQSLNEKINPSLLTPSNKAYVSKWTNRIAIWRFFERYVVPLSIKYNEETEDYLNYHNNIINSFCDKKILNQTNPFHAYGHAFPAIMKTWEPFIKKYVKLFTVKTKNGYSLKDDFLSVASIAFLHALEKQAMAILSNSHKAQGIPFPNRLGRSIQKSMNSELPYLTGPVRVPSDSKARKDGNLPIAIPFDNFFKDE